MKHLLFAINQINQALKNNKIEIAIKYTKLNLVFIKLLITRGIISSYTLSHSLKGYIKLNVFFKFYENNPAFQSITNISTPGRYIYWKNHEIRKHSALNVTSIYILCNPYLGLCTNVEALRYGQGGVIIAEIK